MAGVELPLPGGRGTCRGAAAILRPQKVAAAGRESNIAMVFKQRQPGSKKWRRLDGSHQIAEIVRGVNFKDGEMLTERAA